MDEPNLLSPTSLNPQPGEAPLPKKKNYLLWILSGIIGLVFLVLVALIIIAANLVISSAKNLPKAETSTKVETLTPVTPTPKPISKFATDSAVLSLAENISKLRTDIDSVDLFESQLVPPSLDLSISVTIQP